jgi:hypothetical protein
MANGQTNPISGQHVFSYSKNRAENKIRTSSAHYHSFQYH